MALGFTYDLDNAGNILTMTHDDNSYWSYAYDGRYRLTLAERYDTTPSLAYRYTYAYDGGDNLVTKVRRETLPYPPGSYTTNPRGPRRHCEKRVFERRSNLVLAEALAEIASRSFAMTEGDGGVIS